MAERKDDKGTVRVVLWRRGVLPPAPIFDVLSQLHVSGAGTAPVRRDP